MANEVILTNLIGNLIVEVNDIDTNLNLMGYFDDPFTTGKTAQFQLANPSIGSGVINVVLFDQTGDGAPLTVANFATYVEQDKYINSFIHRSVPNFVVQGGGFTYDATGLGTIATNDSVQNEFSSLRSNTLGTIAMAKLGNNPNSATSQWFFNLGDNSGNLDNQNGGFTVFGQAQSASDLATIAAIAAVDLTLTDIINNVNPTFADTPIINYNPNQPLTANNFIRFSDIGIIQQEELSFSIIGNSNPSLVVPRLENQELALDYLPDQIGLADITLRATNLFGNFIDHTFSVTVLPNLPIIDPLVLNGSTAQIAYVAYYGRPGDQGGLNFWNQQLTNNNVSYSPRNGDQLTGSAAGVYNNIVNEFGNAEEANRLFAGLNNTEKVNQVYNFAFNRNAEAEGLNFWVPLIDSGAVSLANFALEVALGADNGDIITLRNKIKSADLFTRSIDEPVAQAYSGSTGEVFGRDWLNDFGTTVSSQSAVDSAFAQLISL